MEKTILIIDDEKVQADGLAIVLSKKLNNYSFESYSQEAEIENAIVERFYTLAIVDIRMDKYNIDGIKIVQKIFEINPFAKVIIISAFKDEYFIKLKDLLLTGKVIDVLEKQPLSIWGDQLAEIIEKYYRSAENDPSEINNALLQFYADAKNENDTYKKGVRFEHFVTLLFGSFGYKEIIKRYKDQSLNEIDLIVRNETNDSFLNKFGKYILIECKNKPKDKVTKNDFIVFNAKLMASNGLSDFGIIATTGHIAWTVYSEAMRSSTFDKKIIFLSNVEFEKLIKADDKKEEFKKIIDFQVKDN